MGAADPAGAAAAGVAGCGVGGVPPGCLGLLLAMPAAMDAAFSLTTPAASLAASAADFKASLPRSVRSARWDVALRVKLRIVVSVDGGGGAAATPGLAGIGGGGG